MATLRIDSWWPAQKTVRYVRSKRVNDFTERAYKDTRGPTQGLKRVYKAFIENERRREADKAQG